MDDSDSHSYRRSTTSHYNDVQLLCTWFGKQFVYLTLPDDVRIRLFHYCVAQLILILFSRLPSIWKTPVGYAIVLVDMFLGDITSILFIFPSTCFCLGSGWFLISFIDDITNDLTHLYAGKKAHRHNRHNELRIHFCKIIKMYTNIKE